MNKETKIGYIYSLTCSNPNLIYYGSTTKSLNDRLRQHKASSNKCESKILFEWGDVKINMIEEIEYEDKKDLIDREAYYIRNLKCVNKVIPNRTIKEWRTDNKDKIKEKKKKYRLENKDKLKEEHKKYREDNKNNIKEKEKKYRLENKDKIKQQNKQYYSDNKEKIIEIRKKKITCDCGSEVRTNDISRHKKTQKHKVYEFLKEIENSNIKL